VQSPFLSLLSSLSLTWREFIGYWLLEGGNMNIIGIDVSKETLACVRIDRSSKVREQFVIPNVEEDILALLGETKKRFTKVVVACESTRHYHFLLGQVCLREGVSLKILNPILTKQLTRQTIRKKKTDLTDAHIIAKLAMQGEGTLATPFNFNPNKSILRVATKLIQHHGKVRIIKEGLSKVGVNQEIIERLEQHQQLTGEVVKSLRESVKRQTNPEDLKLLSSIPGIGETLATAVLTELGEVKRFRDARSLVSFMGLDPRVKQSGSSLKRNTHLTKRGSPYLRRDLYIATSIAVRCDQDLKEYFEKKRKEGKAYKEAIIATSRKLTARIYVVLKRKTPYLAT
jgi:transposase